MSRLRSQVHFLNVLLNASKAQRTGLIRTLDQQQLNFLSELLHNLDSVVPIDKQDEKILHKKPYIAVIGKLQTPAAKRKRLLRKHQLAIFKVLDYFREKLLSVSEAAQHEFE